MHAEINGLEGKEAFKTMLMQEQQNIYVNGEKSSKRSISEDLDTLILQCVVEVEEVANGDDQGTALGINENAPLFTESFSGALESSVKGDVVDEEAMIMSERTGLTSDEGGESSREREYKIKDQERIKELSAKLEELVASESSVNETSADKPKTTSKTQKTKKETDMPEKRSDKIQAALEKLLAESSDIEGAALVGIDGLVLAARLPVAKFDDAVLGATAAAMLGLSKKSLKTLSKGNFAQTLVQGSDGNMVVTNVDANTILVCLTPKEVNLGMVFLEARKLAEQMASVLS